MPFLTSDHGRHELTPGTHILGGRDERSIPHGALSELPAAASITVAPPGAPVIRRLAPDLVKINGRRLGKRARLLRDGMRIEVGSYLLTYATASPDRRPIPEAATVLAPGVRLAKVPARLVDVRGGRSYDLRRGDIVIGRGSAYDIVIEGNDISRRHARITMGPSGAQLIDESANGTYVNGERVDGSRALQPSDVVRMGSVELRYEVVAPVAARDATPNVRKAEALATLEVIGGPLAGTTYAISRHVCSLGRGKANDVCVKDDSVSTSHATLMVKGESWVVVDLRSVNGTFVDGYKVAGERVLPAGCTLRVGSIKMRFRPSVTAPPEGYGTRRVVGFAERLSKLINE
jgi:pSer/pThr/pTyr-binding forkhead associated (FHA) protein